MYLPMQREPVQRSIVGQTRDNRGPTPDCVTPGGTAEQGVEPSFLGAIDDLMQQQQYLNEWSRPIIPTIGSLGI
jgi:hypothetical protein